MTQAFCVRTHLCTSMSCILLNTNALTSHFIVNINPCWCSPQLLSSFYSHIVAKHYTPMLHLVLFILNIDSSRLFFLLFSYPHARNLIHFVSFIEIYQIWLDNFEEIVIISSIKTVIPPDKQHKWVKRAKYQKTAHRPFSIDLKIVQNVIFSKNTTLQSVFL